MQRDEYENIFKEFEYGKLIKSYEDCNNEIKSQL
jgi:hypothetical protein